MNKLEMEFFEEYKKLDVTLKNKYSTKTGVTSYIENMERFSDGEIFVPSWREDYKALKHYRWLRNKLAHEAGEDVDLNKSDLAGLKKFFANVSKNKDPYALYLASKKGKKGSIVFKILAFFIIIVVIYAAIFYFVM
jgi:hypothetical protein